MKKLQRCLQTILANNNLGVDATFTYVTIICPLSWHLYCQSYLLVARDVAYPRKHVALHSENEEAWQQEKKKSIVGIQKMGARRKNISKLRMSCNKVCKRARRKLSNEHPGTASDPAECLSPMAGPVVLVENWEVRWKLRNSNNERCDDRIR